MQQAWLSQDLIRQHIAQLRQALPLLMKGILEVAGNPEVHNGLMILNINPSQNIVELNWVNADMVPPGDGAVADMARQCKPGDIALMTVLIRHGDGGRSAYLITPMVSWRTFPEGYAILSEAHLPAPTPRAPQGTKTWAPDPNPFENL